jgi:hypothetical protein
LVSAICALTREAIVSLDTGASPTSAAITSKLTAPTPGALGPVAERLLGIADKNHGLERGIEWRQVLHNGRQGWYEFYLRRLLSRMGKTHAYRSCGGAGHDLDYRTCARTDCASEFLFAGRVPSATSPAKGERIH